MRRNRILEMSADELHEVDGVVFDADSYARYLQHCGEEKPRPLEEAACGAAEEPAEETASPQPSPTFYADPQHVGWYPAQADQPPVPIMAGAAAPAVPEVAEPAPRYFIAPVQTVEVIRTPVGQTQTRRLVYGGGSGSGSYLTSFTTSFLTSYRFGSGSGSFFSSGSCIFAVGGYGLELI